MTSFQVECFLTVARFLNFTEAANHLFVAQSSLSRNVSNLEKELKISQENLHHTSLQEAWENNRGELCSFCAKRAAANEQGGTNAVTPANP